MSDQRNQSGEEDDPLLQDLYRASAGDVPDPRLDARIREAAAAATARRSRWTRVRAAAAGAASAAVVVVAVTLVLGGDEPALRGEEPARPAAVTAERRQPAAARREEAAAAPPREQRLFSERAGAPAADTATASRAADETGAEREDDGEAAPAAEAKLDQLITPARYGQQPAEPAPTAGIRVTDPACPEPFPLPEGASIRTLDDGLEVRLAGEVYRLTCSGGAWARQEVAPAP